MEYADVKGDDGEASQESQPFDACEVLAPPFDRRERCLAHMRPVLSAIVE